MVETKLLEQIVKEELHDEQVEINLASGGWTADTYILRSSGEESFILKVRNVLNPFESEVLKKMSESDLLFITPEILIQRDIGRDYFTFYSFLKGKTYENRTRGQIISIAKNLAEFHRKTRNLRFDSVPKIKNYTIEEAREVLAGLPIPDKVSDSIYQTIEESSKGALTLVHNDFCDGNIVFSEQTPEEVFGVIDFENSHIDRRVKDVANAMLWDCYDKDTGKFNRQYIRTFLGTYNSIFPLGNENLFLRAYIIMRLAIQKKHFGKKETENKLEWVLSTNLLD